MTPPPGTPPNAAFLTTRWTSVCAAKSDSEDGRRALADLCDAYYEPVVAYLGAVLRDADAGREMSHAFFAHVLAGGAIEHADRERGRFRFYLLGAVKHFVAHRREADLRLRRGCGEKPMSLHHDGGAAFDVPDARQASPEAAYDRQWAVTVLARAMKALEDECAAAGRLAMLEHLRPWLLGESAHGDQSHAAAALGISAGAMKSAVHRLRRRYRDLVRAEVAGTLADGAQVEEEMHALLQALGA